MRFLAAERILFGMVSALCLHLCSLAIAQDPPAQSAKPNAVSKEVKKEKKAQFAKLGGESKPKPKPANIDRAAEIKRLVSSYESIAIRFADRMVLASTEEEQEAAARHQPSAGSARPTVSLMAGLVASDPTDEPALDALIFLSKFVDVPDLNSTMEQADVEPYDLLLEHHGDNEKIVEALRRLPRGDRKDEFLQALFDKTFSPYVRWSAGAQLIASLRRNDRSEEIVPVVNAMAEDRYLEGVNVGSKNAKEWAQAKLREINTLGIGKPFPDVFGEKLDGTTGRISDYRGKVVLLDAWTTWCGPCIKMIPHQTELFESLSDENFAILSVSCDREKTKLESFLKETEMPWDHWWVSGMESEFVKTLNIASFPTIYVLDAKGVIRFKGVRNEELTAAIRELLDEVKEDK